LIFKTFLFQFVNTFTAMYYIAFIKRANGIFFYYNFFPMKIVLIVLSHIDFGSWVKAGTLKDRCKQNFMDERGQFLQYINDEWGLMLLMRCGFVDEYWIQLVPGQWLYQLYVCGRAEWRPWRTVCHRCSWHTIPGVCLCSRELALARVLILSPLFSCVAVQCHRQLSGVLGQQRHVGGCARRRAHAPTAHCHSPTFMLF